MAYASKGKYTIGKVDGADGFHFFSTENDEYPLDLWKVIFLFILYHGI